MGSSVFKTLLWVHAVTFFLCGMEFGAATSAVPTITLGHIYSEFIVTAVAVSMLRYPHSLPPHTHTDLCAYFYSMLTAIDTPWVTVSFLPDTAVHSPPFCTP
jgi:hypothetical protein